MMLMSASITWWQAAKIRTLFNTRHHRVQRARRSDALVLAASSAMIAVLVQAIMFGLLIASFIPGRHRPSRRA
jgi:hypothetical protein